MGNFATCPCLSYSGRLPTNLPSPDVQGLCKNGVCVCQPGYRGSYCEISPACSGILDQAGNCCATGVVSQNGTCCGQVTPPSLSPQQACLGCGLWRPQDDMQEQSIWLDASCQ